MMNFSEEQHLEELVPLYEEAFIWLNAAATECVKTRNVDLELMIEGCQHTAQMVSDIIQRDPCPIRQQALEQLKLTLENHLKVLRTKKLQLDSGLPSLHNLQASGKSNSDEDKRANGRHLAIEETILKPGNVSFKDIAGLTEAKQLLMEAIVMPLQYPQLFTGGRKPWRRILLYGPPGTGKSRLAQAVSSEISSTFYSVSSSDLISSWVGESEKLIKELFKHAMSKAGRSVIFIDEIDSICRCRSSREEEHTRRIKTELLRQMEGVDNPSGLEKLFLMCATNRPWELDSAFLRRFQKRIYIPLPDENARKALFKIHSAMSDVQLTGQELDDFAGQTKGYSGSDISNVILSALFEPIHDMQKATYWKELPDQTYTPCLSQESGGIEGVLSDFPQEKVKPRNVTVRDLLRSLESCQKTVSQDELDQFQEFTRQMGQSGR
ncbi:uncharacterized protein [Apostichopus japonicus]|uniref:uncharacterized protein n=1 Tax=Stichopus japonicus TaxID=307972 RepID=UPI003AB274CA